MGPNLCWTPTKVADSVSGGPRRRWGKKGLHDVPWGYEKYPETSRVSQKHWIAKVFTSPNYGAERYNPFLGPL